MGSRASLDRDPAASGAFLASLSQPYRRDADWFRVRDGSLTFPRAVGRRGTKGPRSLVAMCLRVLADAVIAGSEIAVRDMPEALVDALWRELLPRNMPLLAWDTVAGGLHRNRFRRAADIARAGGTQRPTTSMTMAMYRYCQEIVHPPSQLSVYISPLARLRGCLVYLCIDNGPRYEANELLALATLPQLSVLEIIQQDAWESGISDRVIRGWSESGTDDAKPFPRLRVLKITSRTHEVTQAALQYVLAFPQLEIFDVTALPVSAWRGARDIAGAHGWKVSELCRGSLFVSYAEAHLDGQAAVKMDRAGRECMKWLFEHDEEEVVLVHGPRLFLKRSRQD